MGKCALTPPARIAHPPPTMNDSLAPHNSSPHWLVTADVDLAALTPVMRQVVDAKRQHPDALILFRLGDFYELFFEDALEGSRLLDLALTSRNKNDPRPIPMCGFPHHAMAQHVQRVLEAGRRCAVVEQLEDAALAKGLVARGVTHVVTPGVVLEPEALDPRADHRIAALWPGKQGGLGVAVADVTTGVMQVGEVLHPTALGVLLVRLEPRELVLPAAAEPWLDTLASARELPKTIREVHGLEAPTLGQLAELALRRYLDEVRPGAAKLLQPTQPLETTPHLTLNRETVQHLELIATVRQGRRQGALLHAVDRTLTSAGARLLRGLILAPLGDRRALEVRHGAVDALLRDRPTRESIRGVLKYQGDLARLTTRAAAGLATPREMTVLRETLRGLPELHALLERASHSLALASVLADAQGADALTAHLESALAESPRAVLADGGVIRAGFDTSLDSLRELSEDAHAWLDRFEAQERAASGIATLKVTYNRVSGYGIEIGRSRADDVPERYHRKQTLKNAERYTTPELVEFERRILTADADRLSRESELFRQLMAHVGQHAALLRRIAAALAELDVHAGFAELAAQWRHVRPTLVDEPIVRLVGCRHPVIEQTLSPGAFVPNDVWLQGGLVDLQSADAAQVLLITGPNMAGKSTLMRQVALAVILSQAGGFVPADSAELGVLDAVHTRIGASDDISQGASTFMVEMRETATILAQSTPRSLVLLDEIGRGTSTWDGLAIAWAVVEALHDRTKSLCLFATHYHELTSLSETLPRLRNAHVAVREWAGDIVFLHRLQSGPTNRSHGIAVARLAGLPPDVVERSRALLTDLEKGAAGQSTGPLARARRKQLELFELVPVPSIATGHPQEPLPDEVTALLQALSSLDPDDLTPRQALSWLGEWRGRLAALPVGVQDRLLKR